MSSRKFYFLAAFLIIGASGAQLNLEHIDHVEESESDVQVRSRREAEEVCKYKKGDWSECNTLTGLESRSDNLKKGQSSPGCSSERTITRNCRERQGKSTNGQGVCVYEKARNVDWTECQHGVRQKSLKLMSSTGTTVCPKQKLISKKCPNGNKKNKNKNKNKNKKQKKGGKNNSNRKEKNAANKDKRKQNRQNNNDNNKNRDNNKADEKCEFGPWEEFTPCSKGKQERKRQVIKGANFKICQRQSLDRKKC